MLPLGHRVDFFYFKALRVDYCLTLGGRFLLRDLLGGAIENDVLNLDLHRAAAVKLNCDYPRERALCLLLVHNFTGGDAVDLVGKNIALRLHRVSIPFPEVDVFLPVEITHDRAFPVGSDFNLLTSLGDDAAAFFFVHHPEVILGRVHVHLVATDNPVVLIDELGPILDSRIVVSGHSRLEGELKILNCLPLVDEKGISLGGVVGLGFAYNHPVFDRPEFRMAFPAREILTVEQFFWCSQQDGRK